MNRVLLIIWLFVATCFLWRGLTTVPWEGDSLAYHLPIAGLISEGRIWQAKSFVSFLYYYPATAESIIAAMMKTHIPLNLFGWLGWIVLFWLCKRWAGITFAVSVALLPSVLRLIPTQTVDIWVAVFWLMSYLALKNKSVLSGLFLGLLVGTKYSGLFLAGALMLVFYRELFYKFNLKSLFFGFLGFMVGGMWYLRNWIVMGNPLYPSSLLGWIGDPNFKLLNWQAWMTVVHYPVKFLTALNSEFLLWWLAVVLVFKKINKLSIIVVLNLILYLFSPSWPENVLSDLRYLYPVIIPAMYLLWEYLNNRHLSEVYQYIALVSAVAVIPQLDYQPKLFVMVIGIIALWTLSRRKYLQS